jgi:4-amino-4-deoxy-L-arabinose transferase-like glycosyltransferase
MAGGVAAKIGDNRWVERAAALARSRWLWIGILVLGLAARSHQYFANPSYWYDEAFLARSIYELSFTDLIGPLPSRTITPPFFLWLLRSCYDLLGPQEWSLRLPAYAAGIAALGLMVPLARRWLGSPGWMWAVGFCALSTHGVNHSFEVRPYATDFLLTVAILLTAKIYLDVGESRRRLAIAIGLLVAAALAPWLSFASAFVLAAVSGALFVDYLHTRSRGRLAYWVGFNGLLLSTSFLVWFVQARHMYYPGLKDEWTNVWGGFPSDYSPRTLFVWTLLAPERVTHYATTGLGVPLLLLGSAGLVRAWQRSKEDFVLLIGPMILALVAALLGKYPFADRTLFFLAPCVWLATVEGLQYIAERWPAARVVVPVLALGLMAPGVAAAVRFCVQVRPRMEYREALAYVHEHQDGADAVWNWCADLNAVYAEHIYPSWDRADANDPTDSAGAVRAATSRPIWVIAPDNRVGEMTDPLRSLPLRQTLSRQFLGVQVVRFDPHR